MAGIVEKITSFDGDNRFLSNFSPGGLFYGGLWYKHSENAYQAAKTHDPVTKLEISLMTAGQSKKAGKLVQLRDDWDVVKDTIMGEIVILKFTYNPLLKRKLLATGDMELIEGNYWGDTYWGVCKGVGQNKLGKILMAVS